MSAKPGHNTFVITGSKRGRTSSIRRPIVMKNSFFLIQKNSKFLKFSKKIFLKNISFSKSGNCILKYFEKWSIISQRKPQMRGLYWVDPLVGLILTRNLTSFYINKVTLAHQNQLREWSTPGKDLTHLKLFFILTMTDLRLLFIQNSWITCEFKISNKNCILY